MKKNRKSIKDYAYRFLAISLGLFLIGTFVFAATSGSFEDRVIDRIAEKYLAGMKDVVWGAITVDKTTFDHGIEILAEGLDVTGSVDFNNAFNVDGATTLNGAVTLGDASSDAITGTGALTQNGATTFNGTVTYGSQATTTESEHTYSRIDIPWTLTATSSVSDTSVTMGMWCNIGSTLLVKNWGWRIKASAQSFGTNHLTVGTTSCSNGIGETTCTDLAASTTATLVATSRIGSTTTGFFWRDGYSDYRYTNFNPTLNVTSSIGSFYTDRPSGVAGVQFATSAPFLLNNSDCIVGAFGTGGATSSNSWSTGGGEKFDATFYADVILE